MIGHERVDAHLKRLADSLSAYDLGRVKAVVTDILLEALVEVGDETKQPYNGKAHWEPLFISL